MGRVYAVARSLSFLFVLFASVVLLFLFVWAWDFCLFCLPRYNSFWLGDWFSLVI